MKKSENSICRNCKRTFRFSSTGRNICASCVKKHPYFLSFVEEGFMGVTDRTFGRVEIYSNTEDTPYATDELRFIFKDNKPKLKEFHKFRDKWDFKDVTKKEFDFVKKTIKENFYKAE